MVTIMTGMRKLTTVFCLTIMISAFAGCLFEEDNPRILFSECPSSWHVEFFDQSNSNFNSWDGRVEFTDSEGNTDVLEDFSSDKKYVTLDDSLSWTMTYTFYEGDIGFIVGDTVYGGDNHYGTVNSGTIDLELELTHSNEKENENELGISFSNNCSPGFGDWDIEFIDKSNDNFNSWDGVVEFRSSDGVEFSLESFDSEFKYVTLDKSQKWTMYYTFYESDIGFRYDGRTYGMNNDYGDSGSIDIY